MFNHDNIIKGLSDELSDLKTKRQKLTEEIDANIEKIQATIQYFLDKSNNNRSVRVELNQLVEIPGISISKSIDTSMSLKGLVKKVVENDITEFVTTEQLAQLLISDYFPEESVETLKPKLSNLLSKWKQGKYGVSKICSYQYTSSKKDSVWGKKEWLDETGKPKPNFFNHPHLNFELT